MMKWSLVLISFLLAGFILPDDSCSTGAHEQQEDGPYVLYRNGRIIVFRILKKNEEYRLKRETYDEGERSKVKLQVATEEENHHFHFMLQQELSQQPAEYPEPSKMLILSDIEGNFAAFRKLLLEGKVIDSAFNWTFGTGHLVLTGDFVDRGRQQTEVLWLIYSLEEKAKAAGGYVHYILGNHEIMNLSGDLRYLQPKYHNSAEMIGVPYTSLIGENTELGRWLRTKNVVEKIGNMLFTHGGISSAVNSLQLPLQQINDLSRPYYADSIYKYADPRSDTLYSDQGPFWFRGYYQGTNGHEQAMIDSTIGLYRVDHIATGHTIIADTISLLFQNRVFNTDVHHAGGKSEALLKEGGHYYRLVNGEKKWLH